MRIVRPLSAFAAIRALASWLPAEESTQKDKKKDPDQIGNRDVGKGVNFYSIESEIRLGKQLATAFEKDSKVVDDPVISEAISRLGQNLVRNSDSKLPFTIKVVQGDQA